MSSITNAGITYILGTMFAMLASLVVCDTGLCHMSILSVQKEEIEFPFADLVADCGGILGLFIGFNFIMVWDLIVSMSKNILTKC